MFYETAFKDTYFHVFVCLNFLKFTKSSTPTSLSQIFLCQSLLGEQFVIDLSILLLDSAIA